MLKKTILLGLTAVLMTACGSNDSGGVSSSGGSGECVDVSPEDSVGLTQREKITGYSNGKISYSIIMSKETESFTKSSSKHIVYDDNENITSILEYEHSISNGLVKVTKMKVENISSSTYDYEETYEPYYAYGKTGKNCEGDSWESKYDVYEKRDGQEKVRGEKIHMKTTIEDVNVEKTVTAGTFNTIKMHTEDFNSSTNYYHDTWFDIDTSVAILVEEYNNGKLISKSETLDIY